MTCSMQFWWSSPRAPVVEDLNALIIRQLRAGDPHIHGHGCDDGFHRTNPSRVTSQNSGFVKIPNPDITLYTSNRHSSYFSPSIQVCFLLFSGLGELRLQIRAYCLADTPKLGRPAVPQLEPCSRSSHHGRKIRAERTCPAKPAEGRSHFP